MGILDSITSSVSKALDVGGVVKGVVDGLLPKEMGFLGGVAGAVVDLKTGNLPGALRLGMEALRDLPQTAHQVAGQPPRANRPPLRLEPPPPPLVSRQGKPFDWNDLLAAMKALTAALNKQSAPATPPAASPANGAGTATTTPGTTSGTATTPATTPARTPAAASSPSPQPANNYAQAWGGVQTAAAQHRAEHHTGTWRDGLPAWSIRNQGWRGQPVAHAPSNQPAPVGTSTASTSTAVDNAATAVKDAAAKVKAAATAPAPNTSAPASTDTSAPKPETPASAGMATTPSADETNKDKKAAAQPSTGQTISSLAQLNGMSDAAIRDAVINGRISPELLKDQGAMMVLQQRMNAITEMNNLMTSMMRAIHDMQMAIVQNIRI